MITFLIIFITVIAYIMFGVVTYTILEQIECGWESGEGEEMWLIFSIVWPLFICAILILYIGTTIIRAIRIPIKWMYKLTKKLI